MEKINIYTGNSSSLINFEVIFHFVGYWLVGGMFIYVYFRDPHIILLLLAAYWILYPSGYRFFYYRWKLFKYNEETTLSIDAEHHIFTSMHKDKVITFSSSDIEKWWRYECGPYMSTFVKIIELRLKDGKKVIIATGLDEAIDFIYDNCIELGMPEEYRAADQYARYQSFMDYIKEIE